MKETAKLKMKDSTPEFSADSLCKSCAYAHILKGEAFKDHRVICHAGYDQPQNINFRVVECNKYSNLNEMSLSKMERIAHIMVIDKKQGFIGFIPAKQFREETKMKDFESIVDED